VTGVPGQHLRVLRSQSGGLRRRPGCVLRSHARTLLLRIIVLRSPEVIARPIYPGAAGIFDTSATPGLTRDQAIALLDAADSDAGPQAMRTAALVATLIFTGARVSELIGADIEDLGTDRGEPLRVDVWRGVANELGHDPAKDPVVGAAGVACSAPCRVARWASADWPRVTSPAAGRCGGPFS
jgi:integrase